MNTIKNLIFSAIFLVNFSSTIFTMLEVSNNDKESTKNKKEEKENQRFTAFSEHLKSYNIDKDIIKEFVAYPHSKFQNSTPYVCCEPPSTITTKFFNFAQKVLFGFFGPSAKEVKNALHALPLTKYNTSHTFDDIIGETPFLENISDEMRKKQLKIPENVNITVQEKNLYTEQDNLGRDLPDKVSFTINGNIINYTIEMDSTTNQQNPEKIFFRFAKACAAIENGILIKRPLRNFFINTLGYAGLLLPYCKEILPYCQDANYFPLAAAGLFTTVLVADCCKIYFERKDEKACKLRAQELSGQVPVDYKYRFCRRLDEFAGKVNGRPFVFTISSIELKKDDSKVNQKTFIYFIKKSSE